MQPDIRYGSGKVKLTCCGLSLRKLCLFVLILLSCSITVRGQIISISARFESDTIWIGEQTVFTITIEQPSDMYVRFPELADTLSAEIEILSARPADTLRIDENRIRITRSYRITSFSGGEHLTGAYPFIFLWEGDERVLHSRQVRLKVLVPEIDQATGIYDIKAPFGIPLGFMEILPWILLLLLAGLTGWYLARYMKRRKQDKPLQKAEEPAEPAHVTALRHLKQLKNESLWQKGMIKEYYTRLTEIIRIYIERRFGITAMELTSDEIMGQLKMRENLGRELIDLLAETLLIADLVKFAKARPDEDYHSGCLNTAFRFVKETFKNVTPDNTEKQKIDSILAEKRVEQDD